MIPFFTLPQLYNSYHCSMIKFARDNEAQAAEGLEILPGVSALLRLLRDRRDCLTGLVTGNLEPIAWLKVRILE